MAEKQPGFGNIVVKALNGLSPVAAAAAIAWGVTTWNDFKGLKASVETHCTEQKETTKQQQDKDRQQDAVYEMFDRSLVKLETNSENLTKQMAEVQNDIKKLLERR